MTLVLKNPGQAPTDRALLLEVARSLHAAAPRSPKLWQAIEAIVDGTDYAQATHDLYEIGLSVGDFAKALRVERDEAALAYAAAREHFERRRRAALPVKLPRIPAHARGKQDGTLAQQVQAAIDDMERDRKPGSIGSAPLWKARRALELLADQCAVVALLVPASEGRRFDRIMGAFEELLGEEAL